MFDLFPRALAEEAAAAAEPGFFAEMMGRIADLGATGWITLITLIVLAAVMIMMSITRKVWTAKSLAYAAMCIALAFILSYIKVFETSCFDHRTFRTKCLLSRSSIYNNGIILIILKMSQCYRCAKAGRSLHMVAAAMAQTFQCIVLAEHSDDRTAGSMLIHSTECSLKSGKSHFYLKSLLL